MGEEKIINHGVLGRPKLEESEKNLYRHASFYFPVKFFKIYEEFKKLCKNNLTITSEGGKKISAYKMFQSQKIKSSTYSIILRRLILDFTQKGTKDKEVIRMIKEFKEKENLRLRKNLKSYLAKK